MEYADIADIAAPATDIAKGSADTVILDRRYINVPKETLHAQITATLAKPYTRLDPIRARPDNDAAICIVGSGPSLAHTWPQIKGPVMAINSAIPYLQSCGIHIDYAMIWDANARMATYARDLPGTAWLIASRCHADVFEALAALNQHVVIWHADGDEGVRDLLMQLNEPTDALIDGHANGITRMVYIATRLGYHDLHCFGADSSFTGDVATATHVGGSLVPEREIAVQVERSIYKTTPWMAGQAQDWNTVMGEMHAAGVRVSVHGDGLLPHVHRLWIAANTGTEEDRERNKYRRMWRYPAYRRYSPGEAHLEMALCELSPPQGARIIDFGCGTGRATKSLIDAGYDALGVDFEKSCLDPGIDVPFRAACLWDLDLPDEVRGEYGLCCDVMEHIPEAKVDAVLANIRAAVSGKVFFSIAFDHDACGRLIGEPLHLTVKPEAWWVQATQQHWPVVRIAGDGLFLCQP